MAIDKQQFTQNLKDLRKKRKLSLRSLAENLGCSYGTVNKYEKGSAEPSFEMLNKLANFYGVSVASLLGESSEYEILGSKKPVVSFIPLLSASQLLRASTIVKEEQLDYVPVISEYSKCYALKMKGSSMEPQFRAGDTLIINPEAHPVSGSFVAVAAEEDTEVSVRKLKEKYDDDGSSYYELVPMNSDFSMFSTHQRKVKIIGVVIAQMAYFQ
ncbi:MAG: LexA family transcriptional regulator [Succinivibrionaceae bacterium]|nr:LexA family transcriptional regulator [Succinivibrionaceae bacterium]